MKAKLFLFLLVSLSAGLVASCGGGDEDPLGPEGDGQQPAVVSVSPSNDAQNVHPGAPVTIVFSEAMDQSTAEGNVTMELGTITDLAWMDSRTLVVSHTEVLPGGIIQITLTTGLKDLAGNPLESTYFTQIPTAFEPVLSFTAPYDTEADVNRAVSVSLFFTELMDLESMTNAITVDDGNPPGTRVPIVDFDLSAGANNAVVISFATPLPANATITVNVSTEARSQVGIALLEPGSLAFTTGADVILPPELESVVPASGSTINANTSQIVFTFSEEIMPNRVLVSEVSAQLVVLMQGAGLQPVWSEGNTVLTLPLPSPLPPEVPLALTIESFEGRNQNVQSVAVEYRVDVEGDGDPWPLEPGSRYVFNEHGEELEGGEVIDHWSGDQFMGVEQHSGTEVRWAEYMNESYSNARDYQIFVKTASAVTEVGSYHRDEFTSEEEVSVLDPGVDWARFPFSAGKNWSGNTLVSDGGDSFDASYEVTVIGREDLVSSHVSFLGAQVVWLDCWETESSWSVLSGSTEIDSGTLRQWFVPSFGVIRSEEDSSSGGGSRYWANAEMESWVRDLR